MLSAVQSGSASTEHRMQFLKPHKQHHHIIQLSYFLEDIIFSMLYVFNGPCEVCLAPKVILGGGEASEEVTGSTPLKGPVGSISSFFLLCSLVPEVSGYASSTVGDPFHTP